MTAEPNPEEHFTKHGYAVLRDQIPSCFLKAIQDDFLQMGRSIDQKLFSTLDECWNHYKKTDRTKGAALYNGFKYLPSIHALSGSQEIKEILRSVASITSPALIDINCRIDSAGEEKYLFDWHQDYWFSICSTSSVVIWIPLVPIEPETGGLELISNTHTGERVFKTKPGTKYNSYADAVQLNENLPESAKPIEYNHSSLGDALIFKFNVLHKSKMVTSENKSRFTIQLRFSNYLDKEFQDSNFRPGIVTKHHVDFNKNSEK